MFCPNKTDPDYNKAINSFGEPQAKQMFIDNGFKMPKILNNLRSVGNEFGKLIFPTASTLDLINERPEVAEKIIDSLKKLMPDVRINKGGIIDKDGNLVEIKPGEKGMHYRNAFESMVAWSNDAFLETPPHEYAHHYIEMFYNAPIVQQAIKKYGNVEEVAKVLGRHYAGKMVSSDFKNWVEKFWNYIRSLVGSPDIGYVLGEAFMENKILGDEYEGLAVVNYQKNDTVRVRHKETGFDTSYIDKQKFNLLSEENASKEFLREIGTGKTLTTDNWNELTNIISNEIHNFKTRNVIDSAGQKIYKNQVEHRYLNDLRLWVQEENNAKKLLAVIQQETAEPVLKVNNEKTVVINSEEQRNKIVQEIIDNKKFIKGLTKDGKEVDIDSGLEYEYYINTNTKKKYERVTSHISDDGSPDITNSIIASSLKIGTKVDNLVRDFFAGNLKSLNEYAVGDTKMIESFIDQLKVLKSELDSRNETVLANDIILYDDKAGVAGTVDLLTYDNEGRFRIYDMKTMRGNQFRDVHISGDNKGKTKYFNSYKYGKSSNQEKHQKQLSGYRIMLNNTHGVLASDLAVIPIQVDYQGGEDVTKELKLLPTYKQEALDAVQDPSKIELYEGDLPQDTTPNGKMRYIDILGQMYNANEYAKAYRNSVILEDGKLASIEEIKAPMQDQINEASKKKKSNYDKIKWAPLRKALQFVEKNLLKYQINPRLMTKYLSGGENTIFSDFGYKALKHAEAMRSNLIIDFNELLLKDSFDENYGNWSYYKAKRPMAFGERIITIDDLSTNSYSFVDNENQVVDVKLTKAEMLSYYLMSRQERASKPMARKGVILNDTIKGRDIKTNKSLMITEDVGAQIIADVTNDPALMKMVSNIDSAFKFMSKHVADTFYKENGVELVMEKDYFPVYAGYLSFEARKGKSAINDWRSLNLSLDETKPVRLVDPIQVINSYKTSASSYAALSLPITNMRKLIKSIEFDYIGTQEQQYVEGIKELLNKLEDPTQLYSGQGEESWARAINKLTDTFGVAVLGMNFPVMLKQSVSYIAAREEIDGQYLAEAAQGSKYLPIIKFKEVLKAIEYTGVSQGKTKLPFEWNLDTNSGVFARMKKASPDLKARIEGLVDRELGEALMNMSDNNDIITLPGFKKKDGSPYRVSKNRLMEGIRVFDAVTIANIWNAAEIEAQKKYGLSKSDPKFDEHVAIRVEEIIARTQPNFNLTDRSTLSTSKHPVARFFTMFSSATQKIAMLQIDGMIDYINNPSQETKMKLLKRSANLMVTTSLVIAAIDTLKSMLYYGWDDDDDLIKDTMLRASANSMGAYFGVGQIARVVTSQLDDKPFYQTLQHPVELLTQDVAAAISNLAKGNLDAAAAKGLEVTFKTTGLPLHPLIAVKQTYKRTLGED